MLPNAPSTRRRSTTPTHQISPNHKKLQRTNSLGQHSSQDYHRQNNSQNQQQAAHLIPRIPLMPTCRYQFPVRSPRIITDTLHVVGDDVELLALLVHHVGHVAKELVELTYALLDVADL